jgi:hypothetical protein
MADGGVAHKICIFSRKKALFPLLVSKKRVSMNKIEHDLKKYKQMPEI